MNQFTSWEAASKENKWQGRNITRWRNEEYDRIFTAAESELDPVKRAALFIKMNDLVIQNVVVIPVLWRNGVSASAANAPGHGPLGLGCRPSGGCPTGTARQCLNPAANLTRSVSEDYKKPTTAVPR